MQKYDFYIYLNINFAIILYLLYLTSYIICCYTFLILIKNMIKKNFR